MKQPSAQNAINILSQLQRHVPVASFAYWVTPNTVLTLSGVRGYCDGIFYNPNKEILDDWQCEIVSSLELISSIVELCTQNTYTSKNPTNEPYVSYEIVIKTGLQYAFEHTDFIKPQEAKDILSTTNNMARFMEVLGTILSQEPDFATKNTQDINDIAFGIMLGYPDKAIVESLPYWKSENSLPNELVDAKITHAGYYICPQPVYSYPKSLSSDPQITQHEKLWSKILSDFYASDFHKQLSQDKKFKAKVRELEKY